MVNLQYAALVYQTSELQISGGSEGIQRYFFLFLNENICCDPLLETFQRDGSKEGSQKHFYGEIE